MTHPEGRQMGLWQPVKGRNTMSGGSSLEMMKRLSLYCHRVVRRRGWLKVGLQYLRCPQHSSYPHPALTSGVEAVGWWNHPTTHGAGGRACRWATALPCGAADILEHLWSGCTRKSTEPGIGLLITCVGSSLLHAGALGEHELFSLRLLQDKRPSAGNHNSFHSKNTIKGSVLRSWAWEQFPPTLLQHESLGYCNCSPSGCPAEDAVRSRGRKGNRSLALWKWRRVTKKRMTCRHTWTRLTAGWFCFR